MPTTLLHGGHVITDPAALPDGGVITNGGVLVVGEQVEAVGPFDTLHKAHPEAEVVGSAQHLVMPGLINAHHHGAGVMSPHFGIRDDYLEAWLPDNRRMPPLDIYLDTLYATMRLIRSGVTCVLHMAYPRDWWDTGEESRNTLRAYAQSGMRVAYALSTQDRHTFVYEDDAAFIETLPADLVQRIGALFDELDEAGGGDYFELIEEHREQYAEHSRVRLLLAPSGPEWCSDELLVQMDEAAERMGTGLHIHLLESSLQRAFAERFYGGSMVEHLDRLGLLRPATSFAHGTWLSEAEIALSAERGVTVCHNASSNLRLRCGIAPVGAMLDAGLDVAIGMDSNSLANDENMLGEMRLVRNLHRLPRGLGFEACPEEIDVFRMATLGGARATTYGDAIGRLTPGAAADAVLVDYASMCAPHIDEAVHPVEALLQLGAPRHVDSVMIAGALVFADGQFTTLDEAAITEELGQIVAAGPPERMRRVNALMADIRPHVAAFYRDWFDDPLPFDPFATPNSRR